MIYDQKAVDEFHNRYREVRPEIEVRLSEFRSIWDSRDETRGLHELLFCILTPQSKAQACWGAIDEMSCTDILIHGNYEQVLESVGRVRFKYKKSGYLIEARERFYDDGRIELLSFIEDFEGPDKAREWFVKNIKGLGYKEASHFLRNIGLGDDLAILDRHILRNLVKAKVIEEIPASISRSKYLEIEDRMREFSGNINIPLSHLDLVIWHIATGTIFK